MNNFLNLGLLLFVYMNLWFIVSTIKKRNDVADIAWGLGFVLLSWSAFAIFETYSLRAIIINLLVTLWGTRLAWHIFQRNKNKPEDARYQNWRNEWGKWFTLRSYFQIFILQGIFLFLIVSPVLIINSSSSAFSFLDLIGISVWIIGFLFESVADSQLSKFVHDPSNKGKIMQTGLWKFSRHPNYFGEVTQWWGIFICAVSLQSGLYTIIGPLTISFLILFVSGVPLLEKKYAGRADFEDYKRRTSVFLPLPPRK